MLNRSLTRVACITALTFLSSTLVQANLISKAELDLVVKEDIAAAQVLNEICPALITDATKIKQQVDSFTTESLKHLSQTNLSFEQLKADPEYQNAFKEALAENNEYSQEEKQQGCNELINSAE